MGALCPNWDILHQFINAGINTPLNDVWIQLHQDWRCSFDKLPFEANLNCKADYLANAHYSRNHPMDSTVVPPMSEVVIKLVVREGTITSYLAKSI